MKLSVERAPVELRLAVEAELARHAPAHGAEAVLRAASPRDIALETTFGRRLDKAWNALTCLRLPAAREGNGTIEAAVAAADRALGRGMEEVLDGQVNRSVAWRACRERARRAGPIPTRSYRAAST